MCCKGFIKRVFPFFLTFAVGLFIASFFITVAAPSFQFRRGNRMSHRQYDRQMQLENQRLREENERLRNQSDDAQNVIIQELKYNVPPVPPMPPAPPAPPTVRNVPRNGR